MNLPRISYLTNGPAAPERSLDSAAAPARAMAQVGSALQSAGEQGFQIAEKIRVTKEAGDRAGFMSQVEQEAADFNNALLTKPDYHQWTQGYREMEAGWKARARELGLSNEGRSVLDRQLLDFTTRQGIALERNVALRTVQESHARIGQSLQRHAEAGDADGVERDLNDWTKAGASSEQVREARERADKTMMLTELGKQVSAHPLQYTAMPAEKFPHLSDRELRRYETHAKALVQERRGAELEELQAKAQQDNLSQEEVDKKTYLTKNDRLAYANFLKHSRQPSNEEFALAWKATGQLRRLRDDPTVSQERYVEAFYDTQSTLLGWIPPNHQGELKQELGYLSPAGRDLSAPDSGVVTSEELNVIAREQIQRSLNAKQLGDISEGANPKEKEDVYRKAEDYRIEARKFIARTKDADVTMVRTFVDGLISGKKTTNTATSLLDAVPGLGGKLRSKSPLPPKAPAVGPDGVLPFKDGSLPPLSPEDAEDELERALRIPQPSKPDYLNR